MSGPRGFSAEDERRIHSFVRIALDVREAWRAFRGDLLHEHRCGPAPTDPRCDCGTAVLAAALERLCAV